MYAESTDDDDTRKKKALVERSIRKSIADKLAEALARLAMMEQAAQKEKQGDVGMMTSPDPNRRAPAQEEQTGTVANSAGRDI
jgi:hypothetical protein